MKGVVPLLRLRATSPPSLAGAVAAAVREAAFPSTPVNKSAFKFADATPDRADAEQLVPPL